MRSTQSNASIRSNLQRNLTLLSISNKKSKAWGSSPIIISSNSHAPSKVILLLCRRRMDFHHHGVLWQRQYLLLSMHTATRSHRLPWVHPYCQECFVGLDSHTHQKPDSQGHQGRKHSPSFRLFQKRALRIYDKNMWSRFLPRGWLKR